MESLALSLLRRRYSGRSTIDLSLNYTMHSKPLNTSTWSPIIVQVVTCDRLSTSRARGDSTKITPGSTWLNSFSPLRKCTGMVLYIVISNQRTCLLIRMATRVFPTSVWPSKACLSRSILILCLVEGRLTRSLKFYSVKPMTRLSICTCMDYQSMKCWLESPLSHFMQARRNRKRGLRHVLLHSQTKDHSNLIN